ncbi:hypothetical protein ACO0LF_16595, partial [Undibacterium sp. Di27W]|uniref:hypothetical protein n=1 Tax=Undibacterium sp. Di27W TaxID=3413036 RepID=UPI003BF445EC
VEEVGWESSNRVCQLKLQMRSVVPPPQRFLVSQKSSLITIQAQRNRTHGQPQFFPLYDFESRIHQSRAEMSWDLSEVYSCFRHLIRTITLR